MFVLEQEIKNKCRELDRMNCFGLSNSTTYKNLLKEVQELQEKYNKAKVIFNNNFKKNWR